MRLPSHVILSLRRGKRRYGPGYMYARWRVGAPSFGHFGTASVIWTPSSIGDRKLISIGDDVIIEQDSRLAVAKVRKDSVVVPSLVVGDRTHIGRRCVIVCTGRVTIGPDVLAADNVFIGDTYHDYRDVTLPIQQQPYSIARDVEIGAGAFLGIHAIILPGVAIGRGAYIGAGAVVSHNVPSHAVAVGNPARVVKRWDAASESWLRVDRLDES